MYLGKCNGGTLEGRTFKDGAWENLVMQLMDGLSHIDRCGILHRDIKPGNLLAEDCLPAPLRLRISDFGCAIKKSLSAFQPLAGTRRYFSPELVQGAPPAHASDVWAAGVSMWRFLLGEFPPTVDELHGFRYPDVDEWHGAAQLEQRPLHIFKMVLKADPEKRCTAEAVLRLYKPSLLGSSSIAGVLLSVLACAFVAATSPLEDEVAMLRAEVKAQQQMAQDQPRQLQTYATSAELATQVSAIPALSFAAVEAMLTGIAGQCTDLKREALQDRNSIEVRQLMETNWSNINDEAQKLVFASWAATEADALYNARLAEFT
eukprot:s3116_g1.t1